MRELQQSPKEDRLYLAPELFKDRPIGRTKQRNNEESVRAQNVKRASRLQYADDVGLEGKQVAAPICGVHVEPSTRSTHSGIMLV